MLYMYIYHYSFLLDNLITIFILVLVEAQVLYQVVPAVRHVYSQAQPMYSPVQRLSSRNSSATLCRETLTLRPWVLC